MWKTKPREECAVRCALPVEIVNGFTVTNKPTMEEQMMISDEKHYKRQDRLVRDECIRKTDTYHGKVLTSIKIESVALVVLAIVAVAHLTMKVITMIGG